MTEQELVSRAKQGDQDAFSQLVEVNQNKIYTLALRMTGSPEDGADLAQEAFLRAWRSLPSFQGESNFSTWLYRLTSNLCIDFLRREKRRRAVTAAVPLDGEEDSPPTQVPDHRFTRRANGSVRSCAPPWTGGCPSCLTVTGRCSFCVSWRDCPMRRSPAGWSWKRGRSNPASPGPECP